MHKSKFMITGIIIIGISLVYGRDSTIVQIHRKVEFLPILSYDTDVGFGYGAKAFLLNSVGRNESFDLTLFNSTKGERWYRFVFSYPDIELRQGTLYEYALDVTIDYDKWIKNSYFGIGNASQFDQREYYTREPLELIIAISRGFSPTVVGMIGMSAKKVWNTNIPASSTLLNFPSSSSVAGVIASFRYDSRNSAVNPSRGTVLQGEARISPRFYSSAAEFSQLGVTVQYYREIVLGIILAGRVTANQLFGPNIPIHHLLSVGGNKTLRGAPQDRFLDNASFVCNGEIRFPLLWRFGAIAGFDAGSVWKSLLDIKTQSSLWSVHSVIGVRFFMDTFVVRADAGFGKESTGFYLNFGHLF
jgi:outer membrane protein assembly factor BamA